MNDDWKAQLQALGIEATTDAVLAACEARGWWQWGTGKNPTVSDRYWADIQTNVIRTVEAEGDSPAEAIARAYLAAVSATTNDPVTGCPHDDASRAWCPTCQTVDRAEGEG